ncbi:MAG: hypothetical protein JWM25_329, partial [Thermoleophilia bacterium]|nr:hypothetical protein [Thermoleophilia bacterium]
DVVATAGRRRQVRGVRVRSAATPLPDIECGRLDAIPVVSVARMLVDLADTYTVTRLAAVMHELAFLELLDLDAFERCLHRLRRRKGPTHRRCRQALMLHTSGSAGTQSAFERRGLDRLLECGAPMAEITPRFQFGRKVRRPDLLYRSRGLAVEFDGGTGHDRNRARNDDRVKEEQFASIGIDTLRVREKTFEPDIQRVLHRLGIRR